MVAVEHLMLSSEGLMFLVILCRWLPANQSDCASLMVWPSSILSRDAFVNTEQCLLSLDQLHLQVYGVKSVEVALSTVSTKLIPNKTYKD